MLAIAIVFNNGIQMGHAGGSAATAGGSAATAGGSAGTAGSSAAAGPAAPLKLSETFVGFDKKKFTKDTMFWLRDGVAEKTLLKGLYRTEKASFGTVKYWQNFADVLYGWPQRLALGRNPTLNFLPF